MKNNEKFSDLEREIRSLPEPDYNQRFPKETQDLIHRNLLQFASSYKKKKKRAALRKKISVGLMSVAAIVLFAVLAFSMKDDRPLDHGSNQQGQQSQHPPVKDDNKVDDEKEPLDQNEKDDNLPENIVYENTEYGFTFALPKSWKDYQIVTDSWQGVTPEQQPVENGPILSIRHPEWSEEKPKQDIPVMIFTLDQWASLEKDEFHIGAAPVGPTLLGQNNQYVFALPARYNFAFPDGYEEVEKILEGKPLQPKNVTEN